MLLDSKELTLKDVYWQLWLRNLGSLEEVKPEAEPIQWWLWCKWWWEEAEEVEWEVWEEWEDHLEEGQEVDSGEAEVEEVVTDNNKIVLQLSQFRVMTFQKLTNE